MSCQRRRSQCPKRQGEAPCLPICWPECSPCSSDPNCARRIFTPVYTFRRGDGSPVSLFPRRTSETEKSDSDAAFPSRSSLSRPQTLASRGSISLRRDLSTGMERASASNSAAGASDYATFSTAPYFPVPFHLQRPDTVATSQPQSMDQQYPKPYLPPPQPPAVKIPGVAPVYPAAYPATASAVPGVYSLPQYQQAQQLFQRDAQTITPEALESVKAALASSEVDHKAEIKKKAIPRKAAGQTWEDPTLTDWPENDFRLFCGDLGNEVNDDVLSKAFSRFPSFNMARVVRDKRTGKTRGYGFVSFANPTDLAAALKEMNGKYVGNRPIKLRKSTWKERTDINALERQKNHSQKKLKQPRKGILHK